MATEYVYHARRYWVQEPVNGQHIGWNTRFEPCLILRRTAKQVAIQSPQYGVLYLNRQALERDGRVYHSKPHEWFYAVRPAVDPERPRAGFRTVYTPPTGAFATLGLQPGCSKADVKRAYKRLAKSAHPDVGGDHSSFIKLNEAYESAMRLAQ
jgi:hypothetical protein